MAWEASQPLKDGTRVAGADLTGHQFRFVKLDGDGAVVPIAAATDTPYGVLQNAPRDGEEAAVTLIGYTRIIAGIALEIGDAIQTDADGDATDTGANTVYGTAIEPAGAGEVGTVVVNTLNF